ncbi:unnamed protein product [Spirodela intermedia]|uniref:Citrate transporter-like domain-containing protein n=1 Tax=Spirodela intermedia TaxID=51605 RepID=A0A7I8IDJ0_SPIIN|nr:unnamed protein product [Spirodela intermedia]CAA6655464.1 unnamed protein product [Spirodela intermedia]
MVVFQVITPDQAYAAIDLPILGLLFGTMVVSGYLERADMFKYLGKLLSWKSRGGKDLLCRVCVVSAISSALFTNDTSCVVLTDANIGSSATPIGNPQNLVIAIQGKISFGEFLLGILPAMTVGILVNAAICCATFGESAATDIVAEDDVTSHRFSPATMSHPSSTNSPDQSPEIDGVVQVSPLNVDSARMETLRNRIIISESASSAVSVDSARNVVNIVRAGSSREEIIFPSLDVKESSIDRWKRLLWKACVYLVTLGMLISLLLGLNMSWTAITAALALVVLDFKDARPCLEKTGIPSALWDFMEPYAQIDRASGVVLLALVIIVLSNIASNVPTVLLLGARVAASASAISPAEETKAWIILAWVSTVAGNLSLLGSAANLIVCEQARRAQSLGYNLSFWSHLRFGVPSTLIITSVGLLLIRNY